MNRCNEARAAILAAARREVTEAQRLLLEEHLGTCASCREERGRFLLLARLGEAQVPRLSAESQRQVLQHLIALSSRPAEQGAAPRRSARHAWAWPLSFGAAAAVALALVLWRSAPPPRPPVIAAPAPPAAAALHGEREGMRDGARDGAIELAGAQLWYRAGTVLRLDRDRREVALLRGEVEVDVTPSAEARRFRVRAPRFVVEVLGTRFRVREDGVDTLRGRVRVLDLQERELATLGPGEGYRAPAPASAPAPAPSPPPAPPAPTPASPEPRPAPMPARPVVVQVGARQRIAQARSALASGDTVLARQRLAEALAAGPSQPERAAIALLQADCLLSERRYEPAIAAYRALAARHPADPAGETAAFALAQLLSERGDEAAARAALEAYLARYPDGRFAREASAKLARIGK